MSKQTSTTHRTPAPRPGEKPHAIVVGLDCMTGLQTARIFARHGVPVIGVASDVRHPCSRTRVCERILGVNTGGEELIAALERLGPQLPQRAVLVPCTDMSVYQISRHRDRLAPWYHVALPEHDVLDMLMDKVRFLRFAQEQGLAIPRTAFLKSRADAERAAGDLTFPCILKPPKKTRLWEENSPVKVFRVASPAQFLATYDRCAGWADELVVQEWVEGTDADLYSFNGYFDAASQPLVTFIARKIRQWPPETGTSCLGEECRNDEVLAHAIHLFQSVGYRGLAYVEAKRDARTGRHYIIEANLGRPTGRSAIAEIGGVELLYTAYCDMLGWPLPAERVQRYGQARWIYLRRDLQSAFHYWRRGELSLIGWARSLRGCRTDALFSWTDPAPFWSDLAHAVGLVARGQKAKSSQANEPSAERPVSERPAEPVAGPHHARVSDP